MASKSTKKDSGGEKKVPVGGYVLRDEPIELNEGRPRLKLRVRNTGDRPIQVGSHYHFMEVNRALSFDREQSFGWRPRHSRGHGGQVRAGRREGSDVGAVRRQATSARLQRTCRRLGADPRRLPASASRSRPACRRTRLSVRTSNRLILVHGGRRRATPMTSISRQEYSGLFGVTTGDQIRLGNTDLYIEVEERRSSNHRRRVDLRRRQDAARRHGPGSGVVQHRRCPRPRDHQRGHRRCNHRCRQGRRGNQGRQDRRLG